ncbi:hypothetical protein G9A89_001145 [Geosiphon pyriformis]|nr:hypothetical protein G9A89_001145 [Geosiphon pyriformis]
MASLANLPYCFPQNEIGRVLVKKNISADIGEDMRIKKTLFAYFRAPIVNRNECLARPISLAPLEGYGLMVEKIFVDSIWLGDVQRMMPVLVKKFQRIAEKYARQQFSILFVGYGIGGAYATLAALHLWNLLRINTSSIRHLKGAQFGLITFGAPRIGNPGFAKLVANAFIQNNVYRVTHSNDWVSREFLPKGLFLHNELEYWLGKPDCDCPKYSSHLYWVHKCVERKDGEFDESQECNLGTIDSSLQSNALPILGPYFGINFGNCTNTKSDFLRFQ